MTMKDMNLTQVGKETTWGTGVTDTAKLMLVDEVKLTPIVESEIFADQRGSMAPGYVAALKKIAAAAKISGVLTYEDAGYWLDSLAGEATPSGAGPYVRAYTAPLTAIPTTPRKMTVYHGETGSGLASRMTGGLVSKATFKFSSNEGVKYDTDLIGKQIADGQTLAALSDRTASPVMGDHIALYIDAVGGTMGATAIAATAFEMELTIDAQRSLRHYLGALTPGNFNEPRWMTELKMSLELNATTRAYLTSILAGSSVLQHQIRIKATSSTNVMQFDFAGAYLEAPELFNDVDGVVTVDLNLKGIYNSALANYFKASNTNSVSALP